MRIDRQLCGIFKEKLQKPEEHKSLSESAEGWLVFKDDSTYLPQILQTEYKLLSQCINTINLST